MILNSRNDDDISEVNCQSVRDYTKIPRAPIAILKFVNKNSPSQSCCEDVLTIHTDELRGTLWQSIINDLAEPHRHHNTTNVTVYLSHSSTLRPKLPPTVRLLYHLALSSSGIQVRQ